MTEPAEVEPADLRQSAGRRGPAGAPAGRLPWRTWASFGLGQREAHADRVDLHDGGQQAAVGGGRDQRAHAALRPLGDAGDRRRDVGVAQVQLGLAQLCTGGQQRGFGRLGGAGGVVGLALADGAVGHQGGQAGGLAPGLLGTRLGLRHRGACGVDTDFEAARVRCGTAPRRLSRARLRGTAAAAACRWCARAPPPRAGLRAWPPPPASPAPCAASAVSSVTGMGGIAPPGGPPAGALDGPHATSKAARARHGRQDGARRGRRERGNGCGTAGQLLLVPGATNRAVAIDSGFVLGQA
jgi:hypothetical protein